MLTQEYVITYVKKRLGVPLTPFELEDSDILFWIKHSVSEFSRNIPRKELVLLNTENENVRTEEKNVFIIPTSSTIISVLEVYTSLNNLLIAGHPLKFWPGATLEDQVSFYTRADMSALAYKNSMLFFTYDYLPPNKIRITPVYAKFYNIELEVEHSYTLETIPGEWETIFLKVVLKNIARVLAGIRNTYRVYSTPAGEIELNPEALDALADRLEDELKEIFDNINPGVIIVRG